MDRVFPQQPSDLEAGTGEHPDGELARFPKQVGVLLLATGMVTSMLPPPPGPFDMMLLLSGGLILWPRSLRPVKTWAQGRFPTAHRASMEFLGRFLDDFERRYPRSTER